MNLLTFPHGTTSLSVISSYLALEGGPPMFRQGFSCPALLDFTVNSFRILDYYHLRLFFPERFC